MQPGDELTEIERFGQIVVGAGFQTGDAVVDGVACRQHTDGYVVAQRAQRGHHRHAVQFGHLHVQNKGVVFLIGQEPQCFFSGCGDPHVKS